MSALRDLFKFKENLQNNNPYVTDGIFYSRESDLFFFGPFEEECA